MLVEHRTKKPPEQEDKLVGLLLRGDIQSPYQAVHWNVMRVRGGDVSAGLRFWGARQSINLPKGVSGCGGVLVLPNGLETEDSFDFVFSSADPLDIKLQFNSHADFAAESVEWVDDSSAVRRCSNPTLNTSSLRDHIGSFGVNGPPKLEIRAVRDYNESATLELAFGRPCQTESDTSVSVSIGSTEREVILPAGKESRWGHAAGSLREPLSTPISEGSTISVSVSADQPIDWNAAVRRSSRELFMPAFELATP